MKKIIRHRQPNRSFGGDIGVYIILIIAGAFMILPLLLVVSNAFKPMDELMKFPQEFIVHHPTLKNFADLFGFLGQSWVPFSRYLFNTLFITVAATVGQLIIGSMGGYVLAKYDFPGSKKIFSLIVTALMFNGYVISIPVYLIVVKLHWVDTYLAPIIPFFASTLGIFLMKQFMEGIPDSLLEAAKIDGAKEWGIFTKIVMPNVKPAWLTCIIMSVQALWGNPQSTYLYSEELKTLPYALSQVAAGGIARRGAAAAVQLVMMIVPIGVFIFSQSNILETMANSGIKD